MVDLVKESLVVRPSSIAWHWQSSVFDQRQRTDAGRRRTLEPRDDRGVAVLSTDDGRARTALAKSKVWARGRPPNQRSKALCLCRARELGAPGRAERGSLPLCWHFGNWPSGNASRQGCLPACSLAPAVGASSGRRHQPV